MIRTKAELENCPADTEFAALWQKFFGIRQIQAREGNPRCFGEAMEQARLSDAISDLLPCRVAASARMMRVEPSRGYE
jgi:hypothetical protein